MTDPNVYLYSYMKLQLPILDFKTAMVFLCADNA